MSQKIINSNRVIELFISRFLFFLLLIQVSKECLGMHGESEFVSVKISELNHCHGDNNILSNEGELEKVSFCFKVPLLSGKLKNNTNDLIHCTKQAQLVINDFLTSLNSKELEDVKNIKICIHGFPYSQTECQYSASHWSAGRCQPYEMLKKFYEWTTVAIPNDALIRKQSFPFDCTDKRRSYVEIFEHLQKSNTATLFYIHGGFWQEGTSQINGEAICDLIDGQIRFATLEYRMAPMVTMQEILNDVIQGVLLLVELSNSKYGSAPIYVVGHSAGAHLICMALSKIKNEQLSLIRGIVLLSGVYNLQPLVNSYIGNAVRLTEEMALQYSPIFETQILPQMNDNSMPNLKVLLIVGENESDAFKDQTNSMYNHLLREVSTRNGAIIISKHVASAEDHLSLVQSLSNSQSWLRKLLKECMES
ncbi:Kynurenine formamidase [Trichinella papuae]|uniref:Kynurenine formamidase n=2 Tax=Trichinella papuae TaxID=268474 RepID=A0A0V1MZ84_9BILA|nr:Kynurenine formamidase [Trichinella papuae]